MSDEVWGSSNHTKQVGATQSYINSPTCVTSTKTIHFQVFFSRPTPEYGFLDRIECNKLSGMNWRNSAEKDLEKSIHSEQQLPNLDFTLVLTKIVDLSLFLEVSKRLLE